MPPPESLEVGELLGRIARRWRVILVVVVLAVSVSAALGSRWPRSYEATSIVTVSPITISPFASTAGGQQVNIETERVIGGSPEVAGRAAVLMPNTPNPALARDSVRVTVPEDSQTLQFTYSAASSATAAEGANAFAEAYLAYRIEGAQQVAADVGKNLENRIATLQKELPSDPASAESALTSALQQQIVALREQQSALATVAISPGRVVGVAAPPSAPSSPGLPVFLAGGLALGLLVGAMLALIRDRLATRSRQRADEGRPSASIVTIESVTNSDVAATASSSHASTGNNGTSKRTTRKRLGSWRDSSSSGVLDAAAQLADTREWVVLQSAGQSEPGRDAASEPTQGHSVQSAEPPSMQETRRAESSR